MASLRNKARMQPFINIQKPSPNAILILVNSTKIPKVFLVNKLYSIADSLKKLSLLMHRCMEGKTRKKKLLKASMTVEAAIVLPLFLMFLLNVGSVIEIIRLHNNLQLALTVSGQRGALYGSAVGDGVAESIIMGVYLREAVIDYLGRGYLESSPLTHGSRGLNFIESEMLSDADYVDVTVTYSVCPITSMAGFRRFRMANRYFVHRWNGYDVSGNTEDTEIIYVTESGQVLHLSRDCSHLCLSVRQIDWDRLEAERNASGGRYSACERCYDGTPCEMLFVAKEGNRYHSQRDCSGLKRTVYAIGRQEAEGRGYRICSSCRKRKEE